MILKKKAFLLFASAGRTPLVITAEQKGLNAFITIKGHINKWDKASATQVENKINELKENGVNSATIYINSEGGSCFEANEILNLIKDNFKDVKVLVGALAASAATYFLTQFHSTAKKNSQFMIHKPMMFASGNEDEIESNLKLLKNLTADYKKAYSTKMAIPEDAVEDLWAKGDFWMTAKEAKDKGLIDAIEDEEEVIDASTRLQLVACGAPYIPKAKKQKSEIERMELSVLAARLGLPSTATQAEVDAKLKELQTKAATADSLVQAAADKEKAEKTAKIKALLDKGEKDKKITADQRQNWQKMAENNFEAAEAAMNALPGIEAPSASIQSGSAAGSGERSKWTYADYQEKNQEAFNQLSEEKQNELINAHYNQ